MFFSSFCLHKKYQLIEILQWRFQNSLGQWKMERENLDPSNLQQGEFSELENNPSGKYV